MTRWSPLDWAVFCYGLMFLAAGACGLWRPDPGMALFFSSLAAACFGVVRLTAGRFLP